MDLYCSFRGRDDDDDDDDFTFLSFFPIRDMCKYYISVIEHVAVIEVFLILCNQIIH